MKRDLRLFGILAAVGFLAAASIQGGVGGCGSTAADSTDSTDGADTGGTTVGDTVVVSDLSTVPDLSTAGVDVIASVSAARSASLSKAAEVGATSQTGCMAINFFKPLAKGYLNQVDMYKCYIEKTQDADSSLVIPTDSFGYYQISLGDDQVILARVGNFVSDSVNTLKMDACESSDGGEHLVRTTETSVSGNTSTKTWSGFVNAHVNQAGRDMQTAMGEEITLQFTNTSFSVVMNSEEAMSQEFSLANVASIDSTSYEARNPDPITTDNTYDITSDTELRDVFRVGFGYVAASLLNTVSGSFAAGNGSASGIMYTQFNATEGAGIMIYNSGEQEQDYSEVQYFDPTASPPTIVESSTLDISSANITADDIVTIANGKTEVTYQTSWDCTVPSGSTAVSIDASSADYTTCDALATNMGTQMRQGGDSSECFGDQGPGDGDQIACTADALCPEFVSQGVPLATCEACFDEEGNPGDGFNACFQAICGEEDGECMNGVNMACGGGGGPQ